MNRLKRYSRSFIKKYGSSYTWTRSTVTYVPSTGAGTTSSATYTCRAILRNYSAFQVAQSAGQIQSTDQQAFVSNATYIPAINDTVSISSVTYIVVQVHYEETSNIYILQLRKK